MRPTSEIHTVLSGTFDTPLLTQRPSETVSRSLGDLKSRKINTLKDTKNQSITSTVAELATETSRSALPRTIHDWYVD